MFLARLIQSILPGQHTPSTGQLEEPSKISELNEDIILAVLLNCDIFTILRVEQVRVQI